MISSSQLLLHVDKASASQLDSATLNWRGWVWVELPSIVCVCIRYRVIIMGTWYMSMYKHIYRQTRERIRAIVQHHPQWPQKSRWCWRRLDIRWTLMHWWNAGVGTAGASWAILSFRLHHWKDSYCTWWHKDSSLAICLGSTTVCQAKHRNVHNHWDVMFAHQKRSEFRTCLDPIYRPSGELQGQHFSWSPSRLAARGCAKSILILFKIIVHTWMLRLWLSESLVFLIQFIVLPLFSIKYKH